jgi:hypothetical protein
LDQQSHLFFINSIEVGNYKGFVGLGIRELQSSELVEFCLNSSKPNKPPFLPTKSSISLLTHDFYFLAYTSGCYFIDQSTGKWSSYGLEVISDTSISFTHCRSNHLTTFASGFDILPSLINFNYVFENSSFGQNKTIYLTVLIIFAIYILFLIWGRWMDRQDFLKIGVTPLIDNKQEDKYFYEIIVFTGNRIYAGTDSNVR